MSINSAMMAGVSGLVANSSALAAISDNIANVNTVGYKRNVSSFQSVVTAAAARGGYSAGGVLATTRQMVSQQGLLQQTSSSTDLGISGRGFFVTTEKGEDLTPGDSRLFTRAGSFQVDRQGYLRNAAGYYLQGWPVNSEGGIDTDPSDLNRLQSINVATVGGGAESTSQVSVNANVNDGTPISAAAAGYAAGDMAAYDPSATPATGVKPDFSMQIPVSDSKGGKRTLELDFLRSDANPNEWYVELRSPPHEDGSYDVDGADGLITAGKITFDTHGAIDPATSDFFGASATTPVLSLLIGGLNDPNASGVNWEDALGVAAQPIEIDLSGLSQLNSASVTSSIDANGTAFGNLTNVDIDEDGNVTANFDNGLSRRIAQVAVATFTNPDGLKQVSGNAYRVTLDSGSYNLKSPGSGGAGLLSPSTLEASTVDLSAEFTGLITTQRAYSASSKIITTADQMLEELINIKR